jgi:dTMP kinase
VLARFGRGLPEAAVEAVLGAARQGCAPDLIILVNVDPHVALARRRVEKMLRPQSRTSSRKGVAGASLMHRLRDGYLALASADAARWVVVDNTDAELDRLVEGVVAAILAARAGGVAAAQRAIVGPRPRRRTGPDFWTEGDPAQGEVARHAGEAAAQLSPEAARDRFLAWLDRKSRCEPAVAAYLLGGLWGDGFDERRLRLAAAAPEIIAAGLRGLDDPVSWELRRSLAAVAPRWVARSLAGIGAIGDIADVADMSACPAAWQLRERLALAAAAEVAASLDGLADDRAWAMRERLWAAAPDAVVQSVAGDDSARAWELRERWLAQRGGEGCLADPVTARIACGAVRGLGGARAWQVRAAARPASPVGAILSLAGLGDDRAWRWRARDLARAPRPVLQTVHGSDDDRAWELRESAAPRSKEALDSIIGMDQAEAWSLRERFGDLWPSTAVKSLGPLAESERGRRLIAAQLRRQPDNLSLLKHVAALAGASAPAAQATPVPPLPKWSSLR